MPQSGSPVKRFSHEILGGLDSDSRAVSQDQPAKQRRRKRTASPVSRGRLNPLPRKSVNLPARQAQQINRRILIAPGNDEVQMRMAFA